MNPVIIIPTYVGAKRKTVSYNVVAAYDHTTPLRHQGELPRCLASIRDNGVNIPIILLVVAETGIEREASAKICDIAFAFSEALDIRVVDSEIAAAFHARAEELGIASIKEGVSLTGYGATRNLGLVIAATLGFTELVFIDDDEVITSPDFLEKALYGLGKLSMKGIPVLVKSGYFIDRQGKWESKQSNAWYNRFWEQGILFNNWITAAMASPRLSRSNILNGGLMALHREAFRRVSFDPWIPRGEDLDYLLNVRMYGGGVWFDNQWSILHLPPTERNESQRFKQDIYRWIYEHRKLEFSRSQIDLLQIQPHTLDPYPGPFLENSITKRVFITALLRTIGRPRDRQGYFRAAQVARREARAYAEMFCSKYFEFQLGWAQILAALELDQTLRVLFDEASRVSPVNPTASMRATGNNSASLRGGPLSSLAGSGTLRSGGLALQDDWETQSGQGMHAGQDIPAGQGMYTGQGMHAAQTMQVSQEFSDSLSPYADEMSGFFPVDQNPELFDFELDLKALGIETNED